MFSLQSAAFRQHFRGGDHSRIVYKYFGGAQLVLRFGQPFPFLFVEHAFERFLHVDLRDRTEHSLRELFLAHFEREHGADLVLRGGDILDDVHGERSFSHRGAGGEQHEVGFVQAVGQRVELRKSRF